MGVLYIDNPTKVLYIDKYIGKIYKILPMYEETNEISPIYVYGLLVDMNSANELFDGILIEVIVKIHSLYKLESTTHRQLKKLVLECTNLLSTIRSELVKYE